MKLGIGLSGSTGRMGCITARLIEQDQQFADRCFLSIATHRLLPDKQADVWIDFSAPEFTIKLLSFIHAPIIIGTTGFSTEQSQCIARYAERFAVLLSANMSLGIEAVRKMVGQLPQQSICQSEVIIEEEHHRDKRDRPSGTARLIEEELRKYGSDNLPIHSTRAGAIVGVHRIHWVADGEEIIITHRAFDRAVFARGAIMAALWLASKRPGFYKMSDLWEGL